MWADYQHICQERGIDTDDPFDSDIDKEEGTSDGEENSNNGDMDDNDNDDDI